MRIFNIIFMKKVKIYKHLEENPYPGYDPIGYLDEDVEVGEVVEFEDEDGNKTAKKIVEIRHQIVFEMELKETMTGWKHWMRFEEI